MNLLHVNDRRGQYPASLYAETRDPLPPFAPLRGETRANVAILGGGYTGLSAALHLARAGFRVVLLEAHRVGFGASGRNGGQIGSGQRLEVAELEAMVGHDRAHILWDMAEEARHLTLDLAAEAGEVAKAAGHDGVFKLVWTREDDLHGGYYRPVTVHQMRAGLDADGNIVGWANTIANQSIMDGTPMAAMMKDGMDPTSYEGSYDLPYDVGAHRIGWAQVHTPVPVLWWRSVGHTHTAYAVEVFLDELLEKAGKDPYQGRLDILKPEATREKGVLEAVAKLAGWQGRTRDGKGYGIAVVKSFGTYVAEVVEVEDRAGKPHVTKVWIAVDCGVAVNPNVIRAQMEGGVGYALSAALYSEISLAPGGTVVQSNFHDYRMLRIHEMPQVEVVIIASTEDPTGVGEPGVPPLAPALANAWRALNGSRVYQVPFNPPATKETA